MTHVHDLKHALRVVSRDRIFAVTVVLTLGLCIGANAAIFTIVDGVLLRPLPGANSDRLMWVANAYPKAGVVEADNSVPDYYDRKAAVPAFEDVALFSTVGRTIGTRSGAERIPGMMASPSLFAMLGARAYRGRVFEEGDGEFGRHEKVVLSYALWQQLFAGADTVVGSDIRVNGVPYTVIGVMPQSFLFFDPDVKFWAPLAFRAEDRADGRRHSNNYLMVARLRSGATVEQAQREIDALNTANLERVPGLKQALINAGFRTDVVPLHERIVREVRRTLYLLWGGVAFVLLIGCVNVTNLTLVRATARAREFATRQALGAGRWQLTRQLLTESLMLSAFAGLLGLVIAYWAINLITAAAGDRIPRASEVTMNWMAVAFTVAVTMLAGALVAVIPLLNVSRMSLGQAVREEGRSGTAGRGATLARRMLVTTQVAFAFMLLIGAGLLLASFREILRIDPGFQAARVLSGMISLPTATYRDEEHLRSFVSRAIERVNALPGVERAGFTSSVPFGESYSDSVILAEGYVASPGESLISPSRIIVSPGYFETLRVPLLRGRFFDSRDATDAQPVIIVSERLAQKFWARQDPIGKRMYQPNSVDEVASGPGPNTRLLTVVGVVGDVKQRGYISPDERLGAYYYTHAQSPARNMALVARATDDPLALASSIRRAIAAMDPELPFFDVHSMEQRLEESVAGRRTAMLLAVTFGLIALLLATVGIYGVLAYQVTQRTREIGIRMALGSDAGRVFALILREGALLLAVGVAVGFAGAFVMRRALAGELYGVDAMDPTVLGSVAAGLAVVALVACALPARRASRIDPVIALAE